MKSVLLSVLNFLIFVGFLLFVTCGDLPVDPSKEPSNVDAELSVMNLASGIFQGDSATIRIVIRYPDMTKQIKISFDSTIPDDTIYCKTGHGALFDTLYVTRAFSVAGTKKIQIDVELLNGESKPFDCTFAVIEKKLSVAFDTVSLNHKIETGKPDTMVFSAKTNPSSSGIEFSVSSQPSLDTTKLKIIDLGIKAKIITTAPIDAIYRIAVIAQSGAALDTAFVELTSYTKPVLNEKSTTTTINFGISDTLTFTLQVKATDTINMLKLLNTTSFVSGEIASISTTKDLLSFVFTPSETKTYTFSVEATVNNVKDTLSYKIIVVKAPFQPWIQDTVTLNVIEGTVLNVSLVPYLKDTSLTNVQLRASKGTVNGKTLSYTVPDGGSAKDSITVTVTKSDGDSSKLKLYLNIGLSDKVKPVIALVIPLADSSKISASTINVEVSCTDNSGISSVTCMLASTAMTVAKGTGNSYIASVLGLVQGVNTLTFKVIDGSSNANETIKTVTIIYDPTMDDNVAPVVSLKNPLANGDVVYKDSITVQIACKDNSGIASVTCTRAGSAVSVANIADSLFSAHITGLTAGGADTIYFAVTDKSTKSNKSIFVVILKYVTFSVTYLGNGNTGGTLPLSSNHLNGTIITVANAGNLEKTGHTFYCWNTDSAGKGLDYNAGDQITINGKNIDLFARWTKNKYKVVYLGNGNESGTVPAYTEVEFNSSVTVAEKGSMLKVGHTFDGWNRSKTGDGTNVAPGSTFIIGASNDTLYAQWKVNQYSVVFNTLGGNLINPILVNYGDTVPLPTNPSKTSYVFAGWCKDSVCSNKWNSSKDTVSSDDTLFAKWVIMDVEGNLYTEVKLGNQVWMVENLKVTKYRDKISIPKMPEDTSYWSLGYCWYNNDSATYKEPYGALYSYNVVASTNPRKVAPDGWHVPSDEEWTVLQDWLIANGYNYDGTTENNKIAKSLAATTIWNTENGEGKIGYDLSKNNKSGFSAYPAGQGGGEFCCIGNRCYWWSTTISNIDETGTSDHVWIRCLDYYYEHLERINTLRWLGLSIRCVRD
jgi:uncharacterized protein (TIGR02145 family)/uncharacterized repeat protein (TIGR02543 family)